MTALSRPGGERWRNIRTDGRKRRSFKDGSDPQPTRAGAHATPAWEDGIARADAGKPRSRDFCSFSSSGSDRARTESARHLAGWHAMLLGLLAGSEAEDLLDRLAAHPALGGPEHTFFQARLAQLHGDMESARTLARACLDRLRGHNGFADFAAAFGAELPASTQQKLAERARLEATENR